MRRCNIRPATCSIRRRPSSPRPATRPTTRAESDPRIPPETREIVYANGIKTAFSYSPLRRWLTRVRTTTSGGAVLMDLTYTRDGAGRITAIDGAPSTSDAAGTADDWTYTYNNLDWLLTATNAASTSLSETFTYDTNGNMLSRSRVAGAYVYPAPTAARPHAPLTVGTKTLGYANGNMTSDGARTIVWDPGNRLSRVTMASGVTNYLYGPDGARAKKTSPSATTLYPSADIEIDPSGPAPGRYTRYPHPDVKVTNGVKYFLHRDHQASVRFVTNASGAIVEQTRYAACDFSWNEDPV